MFTKPTTDLYGVGLHYIDLPAERVGFRRGLPDVVKQIPFSAIGVSTDSKQFSVIKDGKESI